MTRPVTLGMNVHNKVLLKIYQVCKHKSLQMKEVTLRLIHAKVMIQRQNTKNEISEKKIRFLRRLPIGTWSLRPMGYSYQSIKI